MHYQGTLFRALNPVHARQPLSGRGAELHGGRFNPRGVPALYTSLSILTALREANQVGHLQPTTLVSYQADVRSILDTRDPAAREAEGIDPAVLSDPGWRDQMRADGMSRTQELARRLMSGGYSGLLVRSFAAGAGPDDLNLVLWTWDRPGMAHLTLIDDENRLSR
ncbi:MAG: RES domain-containing protein [Rhizobium sp.]|nr:RES domain-containing protein [Rhizobium sp.]